VTATASESSNHEREKVFLMARMGLCSPQGAVLALLALLVTTAAVLLAAPRAGAFEDTWAGKRAAAATAGPRWEPQMGMVGMSHVGGTAMKRSCALAWNGSAWEYGSGCDEGRSETFREFPTAKTRLP